MASELDRPAQQPHSPGALCCWIVTDGKAGMESQCLGLAAALGLTPEIKRVRLRPPWRQLTPYFRLGQQHAFASGSDPLLPPWPDLLIATGRQSIAASMMVRERSRSQGRGTITIQLQNPAIAPQHFDLVVTPRHDRLEGQNVIATRGALHRITPDVLSNGMRQLPPDVLTLPRPITAVLLGGSNDVYELTPAVMTVLAGQIAAAVRRTAGSVVVTPSRRTDPECVTILRHELQALPQFVWNGAGANPYFGLLGLADFLIVTCDSVNMVSEACATGKPVYVAELPGGSEKFHRFHRLMREDGLTRPFAGELAPYAYAPLDDMREVVARVRALLGRGA